jgi:DNA modification methylase
MDKRLTILAGDCRETLKGLPDEAVQCVVTSPPYWGLRSYCAKDDPAKAAEMGSEKTPEEFVANLVGLMREVRRVLRKDGTLWLNLGDSYAAASSGSAQSGLKALAEKHRPGSVRKNHAYQDRPEIFTERKVPAGLKPKDLVGIPWRVALALQADGWWLRSDIIWHKPNPMPESVRDRPTKAHEYVFLLTKAERYYYDAEAVTEECSPNTHARLAQDVVNQKGSARAHGGGKTNGPMKAVVRSSCKGSQFHDGKNAQVHPNTGKNRKLGEHGQVKNNAGFDAALAVMTVRRNKRSVWTVASARYKEAHFATFPPALVEPCILAGCPVGGLVLDPFGGSGTVAEVALKLGRRVVLCELNGKYLPLIEKRTSGVQLGLI